MEGGEADVRCTPSRPPDQPPGQPSSLVARPGGPNPGRQDQRPHPTGHVSTPGRVAAVARCIPAEQPGSPGDVVSVEAGDVRGRAAAAGGHRVALPQGSGGVPGQGVRLDQRDPRGDGQGGALGQGNRLFEQDGSGMGGAAMDGVLPGPQVVAGREVTTAGLAPGQRRPRASGRPAARPRWPMRPTTIGRDRSAPAGQASRPRPAGSGRAGTRPDPVPNRAGPGRPALVPPPASLVPPRGQGPSRSTVHGAVRHRPTLAVSRTSRSRLPVRVATRRVRPAGPSGDPPRSGRGTRLRSGPDRLRDPGPPGYLPGAGDPSGAGGWWLVRSPESRLRVSW